MWEIGIIVGVLGIVVGIPGIIYGYLGFKSAKESDKKLDIANQELLIIRKTRRI